MTSLTDPSAFPDDWYGWLTNQISHIGLGVFLTFALCSLYWLINGEMPYRVAAYMVIASGYLAFEIYVQGWRRFDTIEDTVFTVGYGTSAILAAFQEITVGSPLVAVNILSLMPFFIVACIHLLAGSISRLRLQ